MGNVISYIDEFGGYTFVEKPMCELDGLILSHLSYYVYDGIVPTLEEAPASIKLEDLGRDMPKLAEFLNKRFDGGTDIEPALREAAHIINGNDFRESDIVLISDFEMPPLSRDLMEQVKVIKRRKTSFFGLVFGNKPEMEYLNLCERYWEM